MTSPARGRAPKPSAHQRGLGRPHRIRREQLLARLVEGSACDWCARPMYREARHNFDGQVLHADHSLARSHGGTLPDRLLHATCNESRGDGTRTTAATTVVGTSRDW